MKFNNEVHRGLKWTAGAKFAGQMVTWGITIFVMRLLAPSDYGLLAMATVLLALLGMFAEAGLGPALIQQAEVSEKKLSQAFGIVLVVNLSLFGALNLLAPLVARFYAEDRLVEVVRVMSVQFLVSPFSVIPDVLLQRQLEFKKRSLIELGTAVLASFATLALALGGLGVWALVCGNLAGLVARVIAVNLAAPFRVFPSFSATGMRQVLAFGGQVTASRFLWFFYTQADTVIVGRVLGEHLLGMYSVAMHLATLPVQRVSAILNQVVFPAVARFQHEKEMIAAQLLQGFKLIGFIAFPVLWGMSSVAPELVSVLLGPGWGEASLPLQVLTLVMPFRAIAGFLPTVTDAVGRPDVGLQNVILGCMIMPVAFFAGSHWGMVGVSLAWVCAYPFVLFMNLKRMLSVVGLSIEALAIKLALPLVCATGMYVSVWLVRSQLHPATRPAVLLMIEIAVGAATYVLMTFMFNRAILAELKLMLRPGSA